MAVRDTQRVKVYRWEESHSWMDKSTYKGTLMSYEECLNLIHEAGHYIKPGTFKMPKLTFTGARRKSWGSEKSIRLADFGRHPAVVLHELAHALQPNYTTAWHGPEFMGIFIALIGKFMNQNVDALKRSAQLAGLRVGEIPNAPATIIRPFYNAQLAAANALGTKRCSRCAADKSLAEFANDRSSKDGRYSQCKECERSIRRIKRGA